MRHTNIIRASEFIPTHSPMYLYFCVDMLSKLVYYVSICLDVELI